MSDRPAQRDGKVRQDLLPGRRRAARRTTATLSIVAALVGLFPCASPAGGAGTLYEAFRLAHAGNPTIGAARAAVRVGVQDVAASATGFLPDISLNSDYAYRDRKGSAPGYPRTELVSHPRGFGIGLTQNLWNGFKTSNSVARDDAALLSQKDRLVETEQSILLDAATAYLDVLRDTAILTIRRTNHDMLAERHRQTLYQFKIGQITKTDVDQTAASLARSQADIALAQMNLETSRAVFKSVVGRDPGALARTGLPMALMPKSLEAAIAKALKHNPAIRAAQNAITAADFNIAVQKAGYMPSLDLAVSADRRWDPDSYQAKTQLNQASVVGRLVVPIFDRGFTPVAVARAGEIRGQREAELDRERAAVRANVVQSWGVYTASESTIRSAQAQIVANDRALQGVTLEASVGQRTTLDVLITQQALLDSRVSLEVAERDRIVAGFRLLALLSDLSLDTIRPQDLRYAPIGAPPAMPLPERNPLLVGGFERLTLRAAFDATVD
ncbi:TolC family outer membrane protein [Methylobacterium nonmethylotrophicum]|uniref:Channel protein TolC n=1 Tax=Methylobacterium nonmethylotrophicum TaxID=1141884 RepID=A0A4Z0NUN0_9HYPH|nr:TolC family outer membrane protein [Methylobacterium nonmethylotrophicum]TGE01244.1 channel protein TolC [Methylobacterium nonmethylotrophicum]